MFAEPPLDLTVELIHATVQIEQPRGEDGRTVGTGFLVDAPTADGRPRIVLVTAAHVFERMVGPDVKVGWRFRETDGQWRFDPRNVQIRSGGLPKWTRHPTHDVAVLEISPPPEFLAAAVPLAWLADETSFDENGVGPGDEMMTLGFPRGLSANRAGFPILRSGRVASYPLSPPAQYPKFLMDFTVLPGNSGGPVFMTQAGRRRPGTEHPGAAFITGLLTDQVDMGIGVVTHASLVRETIARMGASP